MQILEGKRGPFSRPFRIVWPSPKQFYC